MTTSEDLKKELRLFGHYYNFDTSYVLAKLQRIRLILFTLLSVVALFGVFIRGFKESLGGPLFFIALSVFTLFHHMNFYFQRDLVQRIIDDIEAFSSNRKITWEIDLFNRRQSLVWKSLKWYKYVQLVFHTVLYWGTLTVDVALWLGTGRQKLFRPSTPYSGFSSDYAPRDWRYFAIRLTETFWTTLGASSHVGAQYAFVIFCTYLVSEIKILNERIRIYGEDLDEGKRMGRERLRYIVVHHQKIISCLLAIQNLFGFGYAAQTQLSSLCMCCLLYATIANPKNDFFDILSNGVFLIATLVLTCVTCYIGQLIINESLLLHEALYNVPWYRKQYSVKDRQDLLMMIRQGNRVLEIRYNRGFSLALHRTMQTINSAYSYFTVVRSFD